MKWLTDKLFPQGGAKFKDDKGLFQGGEQGRPLGGLRDLLGMASRDAYGNKDTLVGEQGVPGSDLMTHARDFAQNFDTSNPDEVLEMQNMLNQLGMRDAEGNELAADGMLGGKTMHALRQLQGTTLEDEQMQMPGNDTASNVEQLFGTAGAFEEDRDKSQTSGNYRKYTTGPGLR